MQQSFNSAQVSTATGTIGQTLTNASNSAPLAPLNLLQAGVPPSEVVWFRRLRPDRQFTALRTTRGQLLLEQVRSHFAAAGGTALAGLPA